MSSEAIVFPVEPWSRAASVPLYERLGFARQDLALGEWQSWNDLANFSFVRHPEQDEKYYSRELLRILGKRFSNAEAGVIWQEVERYRQEFVARYGPPQGAVGGPSFTQAAREWYALFGRSFEKEWFLSIPLDLNYARSGVERVRGRWLRFVQPDLLPFIEAGFSPWEVLRTLRGLYPNGWIGVIGCWRRGDTAELARMWAILAARLLQFDLDEAALAMALEEIRQYAANRPELSSPVRIALEYFRRLELAGLNTPACQGSVPPGY